MEFPFGEPAIFQMAVEGADDDFGNQTVTFGDEVTVEGCAFAPASSQELYGVGRNQVITNDQLFVPAGTVVTARSKVKIRGVDYKVKGRPAVWRSPFTGWEPGTVVDLEVVDG